MSEGARLAVESLSIEYGARRVVDGLSFELTPGRCLGIIGESGAGKSQALLALLGLLPPRARVTGRAQLGDIDLLANAAAVRGRRVAMIFQDPMSALTPHLTIGDQVAEPLVVHRGLDRNAARRAAARLLTQVRLADVERRLDQYPHELSGGMRQRVMIAMALACDPEVLLADEPTTALDVSVQAEILALLRALSAERALALAVVTHDMSVIATLADDVLVMRAGVVVERGAVAQILGAPAHPYTRELLAAFPDIARAGAPDTGVVGELTLSARHVQVSHRVRAGMFRRASVIAAVDDVSLEVRAGEALGIVGESGSGKTTLARALTALGARGGGEIVWLGTPIEGLSTRELRPLRAAVQIVFQDPFASLDPRMRVADIVAEPLRALRPELGAAERGARVRRALDDVGLGVELARRRSRELSGGQCQRVAIARAMVLEPKLLVCDEAVSALDVSIQAQLLELFGRFKRERGLALVFVSHNLAVVRNLCERVLVMYLGRVVEAGPGAQVLAAPRHPYTRLLLDAVPRLDPTAERARLAARQAVADPPSAIERPSGCAFRTRCPSAIERCAATSPGPETCETHEVACFRWRELVKQG